MLNATPPDWKNLRTCATARRSMHRVAEHALVWCNIGRRHAEHPYERREGSLALYYATVGRPGASTHANVESGWYTYGMRVVVCVCVFGMVFGKLLILCSSIKRHQQFGGAAVLGTVPVLFLVCSVHHRHQPPPAPSNAVVSSCGPVRYGAVFNSPPTAQRVSVFACKRVRALFCPASADNDAECWSFGAPATRAAYARCMDNSV